MFKGTILVDDKLATNVEGVYAAGDCAMVTNRITGQPAMVAHGIFRQHGGPYPGAGAGRRDVSYPGVLGTGVVKMPGLNGGQNRTFRRAGKSSRIRPRLLSGGDG